MIRNGIVALLLAGWPVVAGPPEVVVYPQPGLPLFAVRVSVPVDGPEMAAAVRALQLLAEQRLEAAAAEWGARVELGVRDGHAVWALAGPAAAFEPLVAALRRAFEIGGAAAELRAAGVRAGLELRAGAEIPELELRDRLRRQLGGGGAPAWSAPDLDPRTIEALGGMAFRPERMRVVVVGGVDAGMAEAAFRDWPEPRFTPPTGLASAGTEEAPELPPPEVVYPWLGLAYPLPGATAAAVAVAARMLEDRIAHPQLRSLAVEAWWSASGPALVLTASFVPPLSGDAVAGALRGAVTDAARTLTTGDALAAAQAVRRGVLLAARSPAGLAELVGGFADRTGDMRAAHSFLDDLETVDFHLVAAVLERVGSALPLIAEVRP